MVVDMYIGVIRVIKTLRSLIYLPEPLVIKYISTRERVVITVLTVLSRIIFAGKRANIAV